MNLGAGPLSFCIQKSFKLTPPFCIHKILTAQNGSLDQINLGPPKGSVQGSPRFVPCKVPRRFRVHSLRDQRRSQSWHLLCFLVCGLQSDLHGLGQELQKAILNRSRSRKKWHRAEITVATFHESAVGTSDGVRVNLRHFEPARLLAPSCGVFAASPLACQLLTSNSSLPRWLWW